MNDYGIIKYKNGKIWIPKETTDMAKRIGLLQYFRKTSPDSLRRMGSDYCLKQHDSLKMSENGKWNWFSKGIGGSNAIDYLVKVEGKSFQDAVIDVLDASPKEYEYSSPVPAEKEHTFIMPEKDEDFTIARNYLIERGIDEEIIDFFHGRGDLYQEKRYKSVCFIGRDSSGIPKLANVRGTSSNFKSTTTGSDRSYAFSYFYSENKGIHLTEAPIDMLSYATIVKYMGYDFTHFNYMSLSGIYASKSNLKDTKLPVCLERFLSEHPGINNIYVHFDNDGAGINAAKALREILPDKNVEIQHPPLGYKDINEFICKYDIYQHQEKNKDEIFAE